ncbi:AraC family transcriptional regulator ligand-binding domain-containing protein, partial [Pseudomonas aeruginosa]
MSPSENIQYDFEWRPLSNYLAVQRITPPDMRQGSAAEPRLPSEALYEWIVLNGRSPLEGLSLGEHYRLSDYGVAGLALQSAGTVGEALQLIKTNMLLFRKDIRGIAVRRSSCDTVDVDIDLQDKPDWPQSARLYHANVLASAAYAVFRDLLLGEPELVRLRLPERNGDVRAYEEYFRVP